MVSFGNLTPILGETRTALSGIFQKIPYKNLTFVQPFLVSLGNSPINTLLRRRRRRTQEHNKKLLELP